MPTLNYPPEYNTADLYPLVLYYSLTFLLAWFFYHRQRHLKPSRPPRPQYIFFLLLSGIFIIKLFLAYYEFGSVDVSGFMMTAEKFFLEELPYNNKHLIGLISIYPYPPLYLPVLWICKYISVLSQLPLYFMIKIPLIFADILLLVLIYVFSSKTLSEKQNIILPLAFSPVLISNTTVLGQIDNVSTFFVFLAFLVLTRNLEKTSQWWWAALILGMGIAVKHTPVILLPAFLAEFSSNRVRFKFLCITLTPVVVLLLLAYSFEPIGVIANVIKYRGIVGGAWGFSGVIFVFGLFFKHLLHYPGAYQSMDALWQFYNTYGTLVFLTFIVLSYFFIFQKFTLLERIIYTFIAFYVFSNAVTPHYMLWIIPFVIYNHPSNSAGFHFLVIIWVLCYAPLAAQGLLHLDKIQYTHSFVGGLLWIYCILYLSRLVVKARKT
jgi:hypothetical protein